MANLVLFRDAQGRLLASRNENEKNNELSLRMLTTKHSVPYSTLRDVAVFAPL